MKGIQISEKTFGLIKSMLTQGYSAKKITQMLPEEVAVSIHTIYKVDRHTTYDEYCGRKKQEELEKTSVISHVKATEMAEMIKGTNDRLDKLCGMLEKIILMLE